MNELYQKQLSAIRELVTVLLGQISELSLPSEIETKIDQRVDELELEMAKDTPDLFTIRDLVVIVKEIINEVPQFRRH
jgi:hypothetical protein